MAFKRNIKITSGKAGGTGIAVSDAFMSFEVEKTVRSTLNKAKIKIYNLSRDSCATMAKKMNRVTLAAGYEDEGGLYNLFIGSVVKSVYGKVETENTLEIEALDDSGGIYNQYVSLSYGKNTSVSSVYNDILNILGVPVNGTKPSITGVYSGGFSYSGSAISCLSQVLNRCGYKYTIQNGNFILYEKGGKPPVQTGLKLTLDSGLIRVEILDQVVYAGKSTKKAVPGTQVKITSLLFPQLSPGSLILLDSPELTGQLVIDTVKMTGDNFGGEHRAEIEAHAA